MTGETAWVHSSVDDSSRLLVNAVTRGTRPFEDGEWTINDAERVAAMNSQDAAEGARAFAEKRALVWKAR